MFILPALIFPLVFGLAIHHLTQIPRRIWRGELRLPGKQRIGLSMATVVAYFALLGYTIALGTALAQALLVVEHRMPAYLSLLAYIAAYPLVYVGAAWVFFYGLKPQATPARGDQTASAEPRHRGHH